MLLFGGTAGEHRQLESRRKAPRRVPMDAHCCQRDALAGLLHCLHANSALRAWMRVAFEDLGQPQAQHDTGIPEKAAACLSNRRGALSESTSSGCSSACSAPAGSCEPTPTCGQRGDEMPVGNVDGAQVGGGSPCPGKCGNAAAPTPQAGSAGARLAALFAQAAEASATQGRPGLGCAPAGGQSRSLSAPHSAAASRRGAPVSAEPTARLGRPIAGHEAPGSRPGQGRTAAVSHSQNACILCRAMDKTARCCMQPAEGLRGHRPSATSTPDQPASAAAAPSGALVSHRSCQAGTASTFASGAWPSVPVPGNEAEWNLRPAAMRWHALPQDPPAPWCNRAVPGARVAASGPSAERLGERSLRPGTGASGRQASQRHSPPKFRLAPAEASRASASCSGGCCSAKEGAQASPAAAVESSRQRRPAAGPGTPPDAILRLEGGVAQRPAELLLPRAALACPPMRLGGHSDQGHASPLLEPSIGRSPGHRAQHPGAGHSFSGSSLASLSRLPALATTRLEADLVRALRAASAHTGETGPFRLGQRNMLQGTPPFKFHACCTEASPVSAAAAVHATAGLPHAAWQSGNDGHPLGARATVEPPAAASASQHPLPLPGPRGSEPRTTDASGARALAPHTIGRLRHVAGFGEPRSELASVHPTAAAGIAPPLGSPVQPPAGPGVQPPRRLHHSAQVWGGGGALAAVRLPHAGSQPWSLALNKDLTQLEEHTVNRFAGSPVVAPRRKWRCQPESGDDGGDAHGTAAAGGSVASSEDSDISVKCTNVVGGADSEKSASTIGPQNGEDSWRLSLSAALGALRDAGGPLAESCSSELTAVSRLTRTSDSPKFSLRPTQAGDQGSEDRSSSLRREARGATDSTVLRGRAGGPTFVWTAVGRHFSGSCAEPQSPVASAHSAEAASALLPPCPERARLAAAVAREDLELSPGVVRRAAPAAGQQQAAALSPWRSSTDHVRSRSHRRSRSHVRRASWPRAGGLRQLPPRSPVHSGHAALPAAHSGMTIHRVLDAQGGPADAPGRTLVARAAVELSGQSAPARSHTMALRALDQHPPGPGWSSNIVLSGQRFRLF